MSAIHQLVHTLSYGDAISGEVLALQRCIRNMGYESEVYAINVHPKYAGMAFDYRKLGSDFNGEIVLHYSLGSPLNDLYRSLTSARRSLIYHNLTPPHWFRGVNSRIVRDIESGLHELPELCAVSDRLIADSSFNAGELARLGFPSQVLELPIDPKKWDIAANEGILSLVRSEPGIHLLHVGRIAPNKCIEDIIKTFFYLHHHINRQSRLWLVGIDTDTELYSFSLRCLVDGFHLNEAVNFVGCLADSEVRALYESCTAYLCMSGHEGFCLPLVEAMYFGLPVLAYSSTAVPDTMGNGGVLFTEKRYAELAELINRIHCDAGVRNRLSEAGKQRARSMSYENFERRVKEVFFSSETNSRSLTAARG